MTKYPEQFRKIVSISKCVFRLYKLESKKRDNKVLELLVLRSVYTKCDFSPFCCRTKFHKIFDAGS